MTEQVIAHINIACIAFLLITVVILIAATRLKKGMGYMAMALSSTTVPVYLSNLLREVDSGGFEMSLYIAATLNVMLFPFMWFFIHSQLDSTYKINSRRLLHFLPSLISLTSAILFYAPMSEAQIIAERQYLNAGNENLPAIINDILLFGQFFIYFPMMFRYMHKRKQVILENNTDSDYALPLLWMPRFVGLFFVLFFIVIVAYAIEPRTDAWLIPILDTIGMAYLTYLAIVHLSPVAVVSTEEPSAEIEERTTQTTSINPDEAKKMSEQAIDYATTTQAYLRPDITLAMLAKEMNVSQRTLSRSINSHMGCNFFEFINNMRVQEAKRRLLNLDTEGYNVDSIYSECGFRSRSTYFLVFKKIVGKTPAAWLTETRKTEKNV